ncbi:hypothetical protein BGZ58_000498 [Dissophora ornata]|nr:hypothetical protein BGZ58_000498 [Dissophora ornata]
MRMSEISLFISDPGSGALTALGDSGDSKGGVCSQQLQYRGAKCGAGDGEKLDEDKLEHNGRGDYVYMRSEGEDCGFKKEKGSSSASSSTAGSDRWPESDPAPKTGSSNKRQAPPEEISSMDVHKDSRKRRTSSLSSVTLCPEALSPGDNQAISEVPPNVHRASSRLGSLRRRPSRAFMATAPLNNADRAAQALRAIYEQGRDISRIGVGTSERRDRHVRSLQDSSETPSHETGATLPTTSLTMERIPSPATGVAMLLYPFDSDSAVPTERFPAVAANSRGTHSSGGYDCPPVAPLEPIDHHYASQISTATESQRADSVASSRRSDNEQLTSLASSVVATRDGPVSSAVLSASLKSASHGTGDGRTTLLAEILWSHVDQVAVDQADVNQADADQAAVNQADADQAAVNQADADQAAVNQVAVDQAAADQEAVSQVDVDQAAVDQAAVDQVTVDLPDAPLGWAKKAHDSAAETPPKSGIEREDEGARRRTRKGKGRRRTSQSSIEEHHVFEDDEEVDDDNCSEIDEIIDDSEDEDDDDDDDDDCKEENPSKRQRVTEKVRSKLNGRGKGRKKERRSGEEVKRHQCQTCGKRFSRPSQLETHMLTHTGEANEME